MLSSPLTFVLRVTEILSSIRHPVLSQLDLLPGYKADVSIQQQSYRVLGRQGLFSYIRLYAAPFQDLAQG